MERIAPYLGIFAALAFVVLVATLAESKTFIYTSRVSVPTASSTLSTLPSFTLDEFVLPSLESKTVSSPSSTPQEKIVPAKKVADVLVPKQKESAPLVTTLPLPTPTSPTPTEVNEGLDDSATALRAALVNIICTVPGGSRLNSTSGSGIVVDPKGIILTNTHIAQYFLLAEHGASCTIRTGSPAADRYKAKPIYLSEAWIKGNSTAIIEDKPVETGEFDFALLAVTETATRNALPTEFPFVSIATLAPSNGMPVVIASYGAQFLDSNQIFFSLSPTVVFGSIKDVFTFATSTIDVFSLGGSAAAQQGSSGGGVADASGKLIGTITTSTVEGPTESRSLSAITASYMRAEYLRDTGNTLDSLLGKPVLESVADFAPRMPALTAIITKHLP